MSDMRDIADHLQELVSDPMSSPLVRVVDQLEWEVTKRVQHIIRPGYPKGHPSYPFAYDTIGLARDVGACRVIGVGICHAEPERLQLMLSSIDGLDISFMHATGIALLWQRGGQMPGGGSIEGVLVASGSLDLIHTSVLDHSEVTVSFGQARILETMEPISPSR